MGKSVLCVLSLLVVLSMALTACGGTAAPKTTEAPKEEAASGEKKTLTVWTFAPEVRIALAVFQSQHPDVKIVYQQVPMNGGEYQTKIKAALGTADAPDVIALEAAFVREYVEANILADLGSLLPDAKKAETYPFVIDVGTHQGVTKAFSYQATPGGLFYRRSLAKEYFGTDDPKAMQALLSDMDKFTQAAAIIHEKSGGNTYMVASSGDFQSAFLGTRAQPWVVDNTLVIDPVVKKFVETSKLFRDKGYEAQANQWQEGWFAGMNDSLKDAKGNPKKVFSYFLPTWGLPYVLALNAKTKDGSIDVSGDWALISGPLPYQWGGTWLGVLKSSPNQELAQEFIRLATLDEEHLTNWATGVYSNEYLKKLDPNIPPDLKQDPGDFVSSQVVVKKVIPLFKDSKLSSFLGGQNSYEMFAEAAPAVSTKLFTASDDAIQRALSDPLNQYLSEIVTEEDMWTLWKDSLRVEFPDLTIPE